MSSGVPNTVTVLKSASSRPPTRSRNGTATWNNQTFASFGATPGTYVWTWGSGANAGSFTLNIGGTAAVPEPSSLALLVLPLGLLMLLAARPRLIPAVFDRNSYFSWSLRAQQSNLDGRSIPGSGLLRRCAPRNDRRANFLQVIV